MIEETMLIDFTDLNLEYYLKPDEDDIMGMPYPLEVNFVTHDEDHREVFINCDIHPHYITRRMWNGEIHLERVDGYSLVIELEDGEGRELEAVDYGLLESKARASIDKLLQTF